MSQTIENRIVSACRHAYNCTTTWFAIWLRQFILMTALAACWTLAIILAINKISHTEAKALVWLHTMGLWFWLLSAGLVSLWQGHRRWVLMTSSVFMFVAAVLAITAYVKYEFIQLWDAVILAVAAVGCVYAVIGAAVSTTLFLFVRSWANRNNSSNRSNSD